MPYSDNLFPSDFNFPVPSFNQGVTPPDVDPDEGETILVAYNPEWSPVLAAACNQLNQYSSWLGTHDEKVLAVQRAHNLKYDLMTPVDIPEKEYPAPYWDEEEDVELEEPEESQAWYGQVADAGAPPDEMTFSQNAVIWLFTGFVVIATAPSGVGAVAAAVAFRTLATRFVLAFNKGDIREQIRVIVDAKDYGQVDTDDIPDGETMEMNVDGLDDLEGHDILLVVTNP